MKIENRRKKPAFLSTDDYIAKKLHEYAFACFQGHIFPVPKLLVSGGAISPLPNNEDLSKPAVSCSIIKSGNEFIIKANTSDATYIELCFFFFFF